MRRVIHCFALLCAAAAPGVASGAYDFQFDPRPGDFRFSREVDPGGGGNTYVVDHLRATFAIPAVPVQADTYSFHFDFPAGEQPEFAAGIERIDIMASLGQLRSNFGALGPNGLNQATLGFDVENLSLTSATGSTVTFRDESFTEAIGVGVDKSIDVRDPAATPGEPFRLRSLDVTFRIPAQYIPSEVPDSPVNTVVLDIGAGDNVQSAEVADLGPLVRVVPEPTFSALALTGGALFLRRRRRSM